MIAYSWNPTNSCKSAGVKDYSSPFAENLETFASLFSIGVCIHILHIYLSPFFSILYINVCMTILLVSYIIDCMDINVHACCMSGL